MMKNRKLWITVLCAVVCAGVILAVILIANSRRTKEAGATESADPNAAQSFASLEEAVECAQFPLRCPDRLNGKPATAYSADRSAIIVAYGSGDYIRKTMIAEGTEGASTDQTGGQNGEGTEPPGETRTEHVINGVRVWFVGSEDAVSQAEWTDNGFAYVIRLTGSSVTADVMTDYVVSTW